MFTGIITDVGTITHREDRGDTLFRIETAYRADTIDIGASICCNGACMTAIAREQISAERATFDQGVGGSVASPSCPTASPARPCRPRI